VFAVSVVDPVATTVDEFDLTPTLGPLVVERRGQPVKNDFGGFDPAAPVPFNLTPWSAHNVTGEDLDEVPEADRTSEVVQVYARDGSFPGGVSLGFRVANRGEGTDVFLYKGRRFRVTMVRDFSAQGRVWCAWGVLEETQSPA
jgi:hypothetical protein